jgi:hypothetical protein
MPTIELPSTNWLLGRHMVSSPFVGRAISGTALTDASASALAAPAADAAVAVRGRPGSAWPDSRPAARCVRAARQVGKEPHRHCKPAQRAQTPSRQPRPAAAFEVPRVETHSLGGA